MSKESVIEVIGGNIAGEKAAMLREHEGLIAEVGLQIPPTTVIASEALEPFREAIAEGREVTSVQLGELAAQAAEHHADSPVLAIRSSAEGDARGTGIYRSDFSGSHPEFTASSLLTVLRSFQNQGAIDFRRQAGLGEDFAVIVQPVIGQVLEEFEHEKMFGPPISGYGYSQTRFEPNGIINIVAGLGGGVDRKGGEKIQPTDIEKAAKLTDPWAPGGKKDLSLIEFLIAPMVGEDFIRLIPGGTDFRNRSRHLRLSDIRSFAIPLRIDGTVGFEGSFYQELPNYIEYDTQRYKRVEDPAAESSVLERAVELFEPADLLETLHKMQDIAGYPLRIEWAVRADTEGLQPFIVQIAPVELKKATQTEAEIPANILIMGEDVIGHGVKNANKLFYCGDGRDIKTLAEFNADLANKGYILVYSGHITGGEDIGRLNFEHMSNAGVIIEAYSQDHDTGGGTFDHLSGAIDLTGKFFASFDHQLANFERLTDLMSEEGEDIGEMVALVLEGDFQVIADETQNRLIVGTD